MASGGMLSAFSEGIASESAGTDWNWPDGDRDSVGAYILALNETSQTLLFVSFLVDVAVSMTVCTSYPQLRGRSLGLGFKAFLGASKFETLLGASRYKNKTNY